MFSSLPNWPVHSYGVKLGIQGSGTGGYGERTLARWPKRQDRARGKMRTSSTSGPAMVAALPSVGWMGFTP